MADLEGACKNFIAREPVLYKKKLFRAFNISTPEEIENMTWQEYMDNSAVLDSVLKLWHAPYLKHD